MKKFIVLTLFISSLLGSAVEIEKGIYKTILKALFPTKKVIKVWSDDPSKKDLFESIPGIKVVNEKKIADILMLFNTLNVQRNSNQMIFANGYLILQRNKGVVVGGFYWQKGRPNLIFIKNRLEKVGIVLPTNLQKYIEDIK